MDERLQELLHAEPRVRPSRLNSKLLQLFVIDERLWVGEDAGRWFVWDGQDNDGGSDPLGTVDPYGHFYDAAGYDTASEAIDIALGWPREWLKLPADQLRFRIGARDL